MVPPGPDSNRNWALTCDFRELRRLRNRISHRRWRRSPEVDTVGEVPDRTRIIEYEIVTWTDSGAAMVGGALSRGSCLSGPEVAVLRCVQPDGTKVTLVGEAGYARHLLANGEASDPAGVSLPHDKFPIIQRGWPGRLAS